ncbi:hypothetical protein E2C01_019685 [Portunus trituberculatus]|uniref:Uncharacterized protein n=1 Tax=Portunus trituberculatus TaxID=210409 RepID=A0A5B7DY36_PORTR|nr:hypothetical protein [Portunus trituberculatus]
MATPLQLPGQVSPNISLQQGGSGVVDKVVSMESGRRLCVGLNPTTYGFEAMPFVKNKRRFLVKTAPDHDGPPRQPCVYHDDPAPNFRCQVFL